MAASDHGQSSSEDESALPATKHAHEPISSSGDDQAAPARARTDKQYVLAWCQKIYYVPAEAVLSLPKCPKQLDDSAALGSILSSKSPDVWRDACDPKHLMMISGREGKSVYAVFSVKDQPSEERFIRLIAPHICDKLFPKLLEELDADPTREPKTERQRQRNSVLHFRSTDIHDSVQLNPVFNTWERCTEPDLKSCLKMPAPRPVKRGRGEEHGEHMQLPPGVASLKKIAVNDEVGFQVIQRPGAVYVLQFKNEAAPAGAAQETVVET